ncbi:DUF4440 domain-containing protein [Rhodocytophaga rosea]|uniref:DUF4440 domain-containing protein n=1 Tax=Rhodocytophaga rosea TaxID=2704465 RepID=A0A6C0GHY7_9BACT|nr:nuclear transport factor 2 family protein [Rhodocytophaga rosea]QHT67302.1 DUF4440 domain-containing protein [Rhodocytophaga rosea]
MNEKQNIELLKEKLASALRNKDVSSAIAPFADQSVMFLLPPPLRFKTGQNAPGGSGIGQWFSTFEGPIGVEYQELEITISGEVAFCHSLEHLSGKRTDGTTTEMWFRETLGLRKLNGEWKITHQHQSVPMYMDESQKAAIDLKPE